MSRLYTNGYELSYAISQSEGEAGNITGTPTIETTIVRTGRASLKCSAAANYQTLGATGVTDRTYYTRGYIYINQAPTGVVRLMENVNAYRAVLNTDMTVDLQDGTNTKVGSSSAALNTGQWYRFEMKFMSPAAGSGLLELRIDDTTVASSASVNTGNSGTASRCGYIAGAGGAGLNIYIDDLAKNDELGTDQNTWCGPGRVALMTPQSDVSRTGWTGGAGGTSNLFDAVNNTPPVGVADGSATDSSQIRNPNSNTTDTVVFVTGKYTDSVASGGAGMASTDVVTLVRSILRGGTAGANNRNIATRPESNPGGADVNLGTGTTTIGAETTGWSSVSSAYTYWPSVTLGSPAQVRVRKATATTDALHVDFTGLIVEYGARNNWTASASDSVNTSDATAEAAGKGVADTVNPSEGVAKSYIAVKADSSTVSELVAKLLGKKAADSVTSSDSASKKPTVVRADGVNVGDAVMDALTILVADSVLTAESVGKTVRIGFGDQVVVVETMHIDQHALTLPDGVNGVMVFSEEGMLEMAKSGFFDLSDDGSVG